MNKIYILSVCVYLSISPAVVDRDSQVQFLKTRGKGKGISKGSGFRICGGKKRSPHSEARSTQLQKTRIRDTKGNFQYKIRNMFLLNSLLDCGVYAKKKIVLAFRCPFTRKRERESARAHEPDGKTIVSQVVT